MRHSQHTDNEILHLLYEADTGVSIAEICSTAHISLRTFYRWRKRYGSLTPDALIQMRELKLENQRLKALVKKLSAQSSEAAAAAFPKTPQRVDYGFGAQEWRIKLASPTYGTSLGRFAFVRSAR